ncbi:MAG: hypothetical protein ACHQ2Z_03850 [Elusimicrobiota bacterium]
MRTLASGIGLFIAVFGAAGIVAPSGLVWIAEHCVTTAVFFVIAAVRASFGLILISAAPGSRSPKALRVLGFLILVTGITTALTGLFAIDRARAIIDWWIRLGPLVTRLTGIPLMALGGFIVYACAPYGNRSEAR